MARPTPWGLVPLLLLACERNPAEVDRLAEAGTADLCVTTGPPDDADYVEVCVACRLPTDAG